MGAARSQTRKRAGGRSLFKISSTVGRERDGHYHLVCLENRSFEIRYLRYVSRRKIPRCPPDWRHRESPLRQGQGTFCKGPGHRQAFNSSGKIFSLLGVARKEVVVAVPSLFGNYCRCCCRCSVRCRALFRVGEVSKSTCFASSRNNSKTSIVSFRFFITWGICFSLKS